MIRTELHEPGSQWLKAVSDETGEMAGFCKWRRFGEGEEVGTGLPEWPAGADARLCQETFGDWAGRHPVLMGGRGHWCQSFHFSRCWLVVGCGVLTVR